MNAPINSNVRFIRNSVLVDFNVIPKNVNQHAMIALGFAIFTPLMFALYYAALICPTFGL